MYAFSTVLAFIAGLEKKKDEKGATAVEYGLLVVLIAAVIVATVVLLGEEIDAGFQTVVDTMP